MFEKIKDYFNKSPQTKTVYRFVSHQEYSAMVSGNSQQLGSPFIKSKEQANNHNYVTGEKYLHFFDNLADSRDVKNSINKDKTILCSFDIETSTLNNYKGIGYYPPHGYDFEYTPIPEYAIPVKEYNPEWFCGVVRQEELESSLAQEQNTNNGFDLVQG